LAFLTLEGLLYPVLFVKLQHTRAYEKLAVAFIILLQ